MSEILVLVGMSEILVLEGMLEILLLVGMSEIKVPKSTSKIIVLVGMSEIKNFMDINQNSNINMGMNSKNNRLHALLDLSNWI